MSCEIPAEVLEYIELVESGQPRACPEQHALAALVRRAFETEDLRVETERLEKYLGLQKYFPFALFPWEKFLFTLWNCTYTAQGRPRWKTVLCMVGRGAGKDGYIAFDSACSISPYNPVSHYNVDICAMNEDQATQPSKDLVEVLELPRYEAKLNKHYYHTKEIIQGRKNRGVMKGRTNNPKGRDGMRSGKTIFNEVHAYPMKVIPCGALDRGCAILGLGYRYFAAAGTDKAGRIEYSDHYQFLEDNRVYLIKTYANGQAKDDNAFLYLDVSGLRPAVWKVEQVTAPAASTNAALASLKIGALTLSPAFAAETTTYTAATTNATNVITAVPADAGAEISIEVDLPVSDEYEIDNGTAATWETGANTVTITVTAADGTTTKAYTVTVTKS